MMPITSRPALRRLRKTWPYVLVEVLVPGGTILALLLWLSSGQAKGQFCETQPVPHSHTTLELFVGPADAAASRERLRLSCAS